jgi:hypothetical protein
MDCDSTLTDQPVALTFIDPCLNLVFAYQPGSRA